MYHTFIEAKGKFPECWGFNQSKMYFAFMVTHIPERDCGPAMGHKRLKIELFSDNPINLEEVTEELSNFEITGFSCEESSGDLPKTQYPEQ